MSAPDDVTLEQLEQSLISLARLLGVDTDAPDAVAQFAAALLWAVARNIGQRSASARGPKPKWPTGLGAELLHDVDETKARLNCSIRDAIADLRKDKSRPWSTHTQRSLETRHREARRHVRRAMRDRVAKALLQQASQASSRP